MNAIISTLEVIGAFLAIGLVLVGLWTLVSWPIDKALGSQEARTGDDSSETTTYIYWVEDDRRGDPTAPDDEHQVIALKDYEYRRRNGGQ